MGSALLLGAASADRSRRGLWLGIATGLGLTMLARIWPVPTAAVPDPLAGLRGDLTAVILRLVPDPEGAVAAGIALGERTALSRELKEAFAISGTSHLLAVSGFNMTLIAAAVALILRGRLPPGGVAGLTAAALVGYALLVGPQPSVLRAGVMALVGALGIALGRASVAANALCFTVCVLTALDARMATSIGFQLSVAATAGLLALQRPLTARLGWLPSVPREGLATTLAASLPTIPIVAAIFGRVSLVSPLANLVAVPLFAPLLALGLATAALGLVWEDAARPLGLATYAIAVLLRQVVELSAGVPGASAEVPRGAETGAVLALGLLVAIGAVRLRGAQAREALRAAWHWRPAGGVERLRLGIGVRVVLGVVALAVLVSGGLVAARPAPDRVIALDVGQGDAFLVQLGGAVVLIDGGPDPARLLAGLGRKLAPWQRRIDLVVLTHAHQDHGAGLLALFGRYDIGLALEPRGLEDTPLTRLWIERAAAAGVVRRAVGAGDRVRVGAIDIAVLAPNDRPVSYVCLVLRLTHGPNRLLFTGDTTDPALADLLLDPGSLRAEVYAPPHHGGATAHAAPLVAAVRPRVALLSVGARNRYGHPAPSTLDALAGIPTYRTDRQGTVEVEISGAGDRLTVRADAAGVPPDRGRSVPRPAAAR